MPTESTYHRQILAHSTINKWWEWVPVHTKVGMNRDKVGMNRDKVGMNRDKSEYEPGKYESMNGENMNRDRADVVSTNPQF